MEQFIPDKIHVEELREKKFNEAGHVNTTEEAGSKESKKEETEGNIFGSDHLAVLKVEENAVTLKEQAVKDTDVSGSTFNESDFVVEYQNNNNSSIDSLLEDVKSVIESD